MGSQNVFEGHTAPVTRQSVGAAAQVELEHTAESAHECPHSPQFCASLDVSTHR